VGNSTITLQAMMDGVSAIGDLNPIFNNTGGWGDEPALTIANDVMGEMISVRFPWKWNKVKIPAFPLTSYQQDYATNLTTLGWLENSQRVDINNTQVPPPTQPIYAVRDLDMMSMMGGWPYQVCWFYNSDLEQELWPGPGEEYINPIGTETGPTNPYTNIIDPSGNILVLTEWGTTGATEPDAGPTAEPGDTVEDGTVQWMVVDPRAQGFRFYPRPPQGGHVWLVRLFGQKKAPTFTNLQQTIDPIPDDYSKWFRDGCVAYAHRYSSNPTVKARYGQMKADWIAAVAGAAKQGDREDESRGFFPDKGIAAQININDPGPYPYRWGWGWG
jgi:hypothetical protein